jgi:hypothetical protein
MVNVFDSGTINVQGKNRQGVEQLVAALRAREKRRRVERIAAEVRRLTAPGRSGAGKVRIEGHLLRSERVSSALLVRRARDVHLRGSERLRRFGLSGHSKARYQ